MSLPRWLEPLPDAELMRATDRWAIEEAGIPSLDLMERAGAGLAELVQERVPEGPIVVVCGKGNNGGDGFVAARLLREWGHDVAVAVAGDPDRAFSPDAQANLGRLPGPEPVAFCAALLAGAAGAVDALLGTGFSGEPRGPVAEAIAALAGFEGTIVAADVPSGVDASTGEALGAAVRADATATFHAAKPGLWITPGKALAGEVRIVAIGIPPGAPGTAGIGLVRPDVLALVPRRAADATKFSAGRVVVAGGSRGLTGAPALAALGAARAGAGYVTVAGPEGELAPIDGALLEVMTREVAAAGGGLAAGAAPAVIAAAEDAGAVVAGPGIGRSADARSAIAAVIRDVAAPLVVDADGLNALAAEGLGAVAARSAPTVLTPHGGEAGRLLGLESDEVRAHRLATARRLAEESGAVVVLKGDDTLVAEPRGRVAVSPGGAPGLATAGTGDVLSGVVAALLAKRLAPFDAACAAVWLHVVAGRRAAERAGGADGVMARDVAEALPAALGS